eukprot:scpid83770/ scgid27915/ 
MTQRVPGLFRDCLHDGFAYVYVSIEIVSGAVMLQRACVWEHRDCLHYGSACVYVNILQFLPFCRGMPACLLRDEPRCSPQVSITISCRVPTGVAYVSLHPDVCVCLENCSLQPINVLGVFAAPGTEYSTSLGPVLCIPYD